MAVLECKISKLSRSFFALYPYFFNQLQVQSFVFDVRISKLGAGGPSSPVYVYDGQKFNQASDLQFKTTS